MLDMVVGIGPDHREVSGPGQVEAQASWSVPLDLADGCGSAAGRAPLSVLLRWAQLGSGGRGAHGPVHAGTPGWRRPGHTAPPLLPLLSLPSCVLGRPMGSCHL